MNPFFYNIDIIWHTPKFSNRFPIGRLWELRIFCACAVIALRIWTVQIDSGEAKR